MTLHNHSSTTKAIKKKSIKFQTCITPVHAHPLPPPHWGQKLPRKTRDYSQTKEVRDPSILDFLGALPGFRGTPAFRILDFILRWGAGRSMDSLTGRKPHCLSRTENQTGGGRTPMTGRWTDLSELFQSACACLQHWGESNHTRTANVCRKMTDRCESHLEKTATEPFRRLYSQRDAKLYRRIFVHLKMQYHCFRFFYSVRVVECLYSDQTL